MKERGWINNECGLPAAGGSGVREACPRFIDRSLRRFSTTSAPQHPAAPAPLLPAHVSAPTDCIYHPPPPRHTYTTYLSTTTVCSNHEQRFPPYFSSLQIFCSLISRSISEVYKNSFIASVLYSNSNQRCWYGAGSGSLRSKDAIKAFYISSRETCKCYLCSLKQNYVINFTCERYSYVNALKKLSKHCIMFIANFNELYEVINDSCLWNKKHASKMKIRCP